ncbi:MAG: alkaline phosphatase family protein [Blastocatellia bacterium]
MKTLVIGLDAATMDLIEPWAADGHLPTLAGLINEGASGRLLSTPNMHSASAWTSILTGLNPGRHGLFVFSDRDFATGKQVFFKGGDRTGELVSTHLARHGLTCGFLNVPMTYPAQCEPGGFTVSGLDSPSLNERAFCPPELRGDLLSRFPDYHFAPPGLGDLMRAGRMDDAIAAWMKLIEIQTAAAEYLLEARPVDFFMTVYTASDWAGHNLWKDQRAPNEPPAANRLLQIYRALDGAIARLLDHTTDDTHIYVISDHGMGPHTGASYHLAKWLELKGYMVSANQLGKRASLLRASREIVSAVLPTKLKEEIKTALGDERMKRLQSAEKYAFYSSIDWTRTRVYTEAGRHVININLAGRNQNGIVPLHNYRAVCDEVIAELLNWKDEQGLSVVERVAFRDDSYRGPYTERASDLYIYWNRDARIPEPPPEVKARGFWWTGDHRPEGILICKGEGIRQTRELKSAIVYDFAPTLLHLAGLPVPEGLDGRVMEEILMEGRLPVRLTAVKSQAKGEAERLTTEEEKVIEDKLRGLGYL